MIPIDKTEQKENVVTNNRISSSGFSNYNSKLDNVSISSYTSKKE